MTDSKRLAATLYYFAAAMSLRAVADSYKFGPSTTCQIVSDVCQAIWDALKNDFVAFPFRAKSKKGSQMISGGFGTFPLTQMCLGAIDGKHIRITAPVEFEERLLSTSRAIFPLL